MINFIELWDLLEYITELDMANNNFDQSTAK